MGGMVVKKAEWVVEGCGEGEVTWRGARVGEMGRMSRLDDPMSID